MTWQLHLEVPGDLEQFLRAYAAERGISIAAAVRVILHEAMKRESSDLHG